MSRIQPSALSPQPSALSPQPSALRTLSQHSTIFVNNIRTTFVATLLLFLSNFSYAYQVIITEPSTYYENEFVERVPSEDAGCLLTLARESERYAGYNKYWGYKYSVIYLGFTALVGVGGAGTVGGWTCNLNLLEDGKLLYPLPFGLGRIVAFCPTGIHLVGIEVDGKFKWVCRVIDYSNRTNILTLTPAPNQTPPDPRPKGAEGKDGKSTLELIAKVMEGSTPKAGVAVTFGVDVVPMTGGHGHHDANRPKGSVPTSGVTDANGEINLTFKASEVAGSHTITATCDTCSNKIVEKKVDVLVPDLQPISNNPPRNSDGSYLYAFTAVDPGHIGTSGGRQRGEYYLTRTAIDNLQELIKQFAKEGWGIVALNDASLNWGGVYDLNNNWRPPHSTHRTGEDIDISFTRAGNPITKKKQAEFYDKFCEDKKVSIPFTILHHYQAIPHFHVYLMGQKQCAKTPN